MPRSDDRVAALRFLTGLELIVACTFCKISTHHYGVWGIQGNPVENLTAERRVSSDFDLEGFDDFDFAGFAEDVNVDAASVAVDDYVAFGVGDAEIFDAHFVDVGGQDGIGKNNLALEGFYVEAE